MSAFVSARRFDLHLHSNRSDGAFDPMDVIGRCAVAGVDVVALTDHDLSTSVNVGPMCIGDRTIHVLGGAEISGVHEDKEYHLLVYFPREVPEVFREFCVGRAQARARRYDQALVNIGLPGLDAALPEAHAGDVSLTRHHLARALVEAGHVTSIQDAFVQHANYGKVPRVELGFCEAIRFARECGGLTSWAHPPKKALGEHLPDFVAAGLQGLECSRPFLRSAQRRLIRKKAKKYGLFLTGGSDWHGWNDGDVGLFTVSRNEVEGFCDALMAVS
jgi:hypothetical protein